MPTRLAVVSVATRTARNSSGPAPKCRDRYAPWATKAAIQEPMIHGVACAIRRPPPIGPGDHTSKATLSWPPRSTATMITIRSRTAMIARTRRMSPRVLSRSADAGAPTGVFSETVTTLPLRLAPPVLTLSNDPPSRRLWPDLLRVTSAPGQRSHDRTSVHDVHDRRDRTHQVQQADRVPDQHMSHQSEPEDHQPRRLRQLVGRHEHLRTSRDRVDERPRLKDEQRQRDERQERALELEEGEHPTRVAPEAERPPPNGRTERSRASPEVVRGLSCRSSRQRPGSPWWRWPRSSAR